VVLVEVGGTWVGGTGVGVWVGVADGGISVGEEVAVGNGFCGGVGEGVRVSVTVAEGSWVVVLVEI
jgi:hypothetical protein